MINFEAFFKVSYGLYIVSSGDKKNGNGYIANAVFQVTAEPAQFAICCNKDNHTTKFLKQSQVFSISVLKERADSEIIGRFGFKSGKDFNKLIGVQIKHGVTGVPIVLEDTIAYFECRIKQTLDIGTHIMYIGEVIEAELIDSKPDPLTYDYYRQVKKGLAPKNAPTYIDKSNFEKEEPVSQAVTNKCPICSYIYDPEKGDPKNGIAPGTAFEDLPDDWICPICGCEKEDFTEL